MTLTDWLRQERKLRSFHRKIRKTRVTLPDIHPDDYIFRYIWSRGHHIGTEKEALEFYLKSGADCAALLARKLEELMVVPKTLLEFASGYGRVTRHLSKVIPNGRVTASDIHPAAMQFVESRFAVDTCLSPAHPDRWSDSRTFDVVFALSFFSHVPKALFLPWLEKLITLVKPGGSLLFTTHGLVSQRDLFPDTELDSDGFYFSRLSEQRDLKPSIYGTSIVHPDFVLKRFPNLIHQPGTWWKHQDLFILRRP